MTPGGAQAVRSFRGHSVEVSPLALTCRNLPLMPELNEALAWLARKLACSTMPSEGSPIPPAKTLWVFLEPQLVGPHLKSGLNRAIDLFLSPSETWIENSMHSHFGATLASVPHAPAPPELVPLERIEPGPAVRAVGTPAVAGLPVLISSAPRSRSFPSRRLTRQAVANQGSTTSKPRTWRNSRALNVATAQRRCRAVAGGVRLDLDAKPQFAEGDDTDSHRAGGRA